MEICKTLNDLKEIPFLAILTRNMFSNLLKKHILRLVRETYSQTYSQSFCQYVSTIPEKKNRM